MARPNVSVFEATERDLATLPEELGAGALAASALALARELDALNSATSKSMCAKAHMEIMDRLRELAPAKKEKDEIDRLAEQRKKRRTRAAVTEPTAKRGAGLSAPADPSRT